MQTMQNGRADVQKMLTARQVQEILHVDRSTVYRMAEAGKIPGIKVGKQWRFPAEQIHEVLRYAQPDPDVPLDVSVTSAILDVASHLLHVSLVVTDMSGDPLTEVMNPCAWFRQHSTEGVVSESCVATWKQLAEDPHFTPAFHHGNSGFDCARSFIRSGDRLLGMVVATGVAPDGNDDPELNHITEREKDAVLAALPHIAHTISRFAVHSTQQKEKP